MSGAIQEALEFLAGGRSLTAPQAHDAVALIMTGGVSEPLIAAFLTALRVRGETADELAGAVTAARGGSIGWPSGLDLPPTLDTCGTGGDGACTVNISTATAIVVAACGIPVAKHGNRSASGNSGSAEVLAELGVAVEAEPPVLVRCLRELNLTFLFAPRFHPALRFAVPVRRQLPFRTLFNLVGPLANPARPAFQLIGVPEPRLADLVADAVARLGVVRAAIVTGSDGLDEVSLGGPTRVRWVEDGQVTPRTWSLADFDLGQVEAGALRVAGPPESAQAIRDLLGGRPGPVRATVLANAAAALLVAGVTDKLADGVELAAGAIDRGNAANLLVRWAEASHAAG